MEDEAWIVAIGTGVDESTLSLVAVTGSEAEASAMLAQALRVLPLGRYNEIGTCAYHAERQGRWRRRRATIAPGANRMVSVVEFDDWFEVYDRFEDADERRVGMANFFPETRSIEIVTNTWVGEVGREIGSLLRDSE